MIILDASTKSLQIKLSAPITTNQLPFSASYVDTTGTTTTPGEYDNTIGNSTAIQLVGTPGTSTQRLVKNIIIQNADTAPATVTVIYNNTSGSTARNIIVATLAVGDQLIYEDGSGWSAVNSAANLKTSGSSGGVSQVTNSDLTLTISPNTGNVVASLAPLTSAKFLVGNASNVATGVSMSGDATLANTGAVTVTKTSGTAFGSLATLNSVNNSNWSGTALTPANGGTGNTTLTAHSVLLGEGTGNVAFATTGTAGQLLIDQGSGSDPAFKAVSGDATIAGTGAMTLATVNSNVGSFTSANITVNAKGLITAAANGSGGSGTFAQCQFQYTSSTVCTLQPLNGNQVTFPSGSVATIGSSGITTTITSCYLNGTASSALSASTLYYAYLWNNGTSYVIDWSTTAYAVDSTTGITIKSGDNTRVLVGMAYTDSTPHFNNTDGKRLVLSWFNRQRIPSKTFFTANRSVTSTSFVEINSEIRNSVLVWAGQEVDYSVSGTASQVNNTDGANTAISFNGSTVESGTSFTFQPTGGTYSLINLTGGKTGLSEGANYATLFGGVVNGTGTWNFTDSISSQTAACRLNLWTWG